MATSRRQLENYNYMRETNFFGFLIFNSKQRTRHNTKQDKKQSKEIGTERLPFPVAFKSPATAPEKELDGYELVNPKRKVMM